MFLTALVAVAAVECFCFDGSVCARCGGRKEALLTWFSYYFEAALLWYK
jgi:hypothetical protein